MPFTALGLSPALSSFVAKRAYAAPTEIQITAIPAALEGRDILGCAQTGSGKTAAFALPLMQLLDGLPRARSARARALVLVPTRELCSQVGDFIADCAQFLPHKLKISVVFGGVSINPQLMGLRGGTDVVVATPGRLLDLIDHNALSLGEISLLVLDEADRLLDMGFSEELNRILTLLPAKRQSLFFSATFPPKVRALADRLLRNPVRIDETPSEPVAPPIEQEAIAVDASRRTQLLRLLIEQRRWSRVLVFVATKHAAEIVADKLRKAQISAEPFHGMLSQGKRTQVLADFRASRLQVVVATDVAARGLDIVSLPAVVNYDLPRSAVDYTHRIGRTGRAGESGVAISFVSAETHDHFQLIARRHHLGMDISVVAGFEPTPGDPTNQSDTLKATLRTVGLDPNGGVKGKRPSKKDKLRAAAERSL